MIDLNKRSEVKKIDKQYISVVPNDWDIKNDHPVTHKLSPPGPLNELQRIRKELTEIVDTPLSRQAAQVALKNAEIIAGNYLYDTTVQFMLLQLMERAGHTVGISEQWAALSLICPEDIRIVRFYARRLVRERRREEALQLIDGHLPEIWDNPLATLARAEMLADVRAFEDSDSLFRRLIEVHDRRDLRVAFVKQLYKRGLLAEAVDVLAPVIATLAPASKAAQLATKLMEDYAFYRTFESEEGLVGQDVKVLAMKHAVLHFRNRIVSARPIDQIKSVALVTGNLGPGGAERQLSRLACNLQRLTNSANCVSGLNAFMPEVLVKQHSDNVTSANNRRLDFFLDDLLKAEIVVKEINKLPAISSINQNFENPKLIRLLSQLPSQVHYGVTRLSPYLRERGFDAVSLWQDGTCLLGALAALLAGIPVIHLIFRGLPPNIRRERHRPEYAVLYRALAEIPGIHFVSNSKAAAKEYALWLDLPFERFHILYNGVPDLDVAGAIEDEQKWVDFEARTNDATETIGGVFRLESDKRPLLWIKLAHHYLKRCPNARFVIVGHGRLHEATFNLALKLGIENRLLLVGHSMHVGFWYSRMNVKVLLSLFEGLPNVLIEAQLLGIHTISTPAGGAGECFINGVSGHLLKSVQNPDLNEACDKIQLFANSTVRNKENTDFGRDRALRLFSVDAMLNSFIRLCMPIIKANGNENSVKFSAIPEIA